MDFVHASRDDNDSSDDDELEESEPLQLLWSIFQKDLVQNPDLPFFQRKLKSGKIGYQQPRQHDDPSSGKLLPAKIPRQTKHNRAKKCTQAIGKNNNIMMNWLKKDVTVPSPADPIDPQLESSAILSPTTIPSDSNIPNVNANSEAVQLRLTEQMENYLAAPVATPSNPDTRIKSKAEKQWKELKDAIQFVASAYKKKAARDHKFQYPEAILANLNEFNYLRKKYTLDGIPGPSLKASLESAQSSVRRTSTSANDLENPRSAIYLARTIAKQADYIVNNKELFIRQRGNTSNHKSLIHNVDIREALITWSALQTPGQVTPATFQQYVVESLLPQFGIRKKIARSTITRWMFKLGFTPQVYKKSLYFDGHERPDVVISRKKYIEDYKRYRRRSRMYADEDLETSIRIDPEILGENKETVFIFHDESTIHAQEKARLAWLLPGTTELRSKNLGRLIHISDFILESTCTGRLKLSAEEFEKSQSDCGKKPESDDAATVIYPGTTGDKWWNMEQLSHQVAHKAIPIFETLHPNSQAVFVFDCSSAHGAYAKSALRIQNMNLNPGRKQPILRDTFIPTDDPLIPLHLRGKPQKLVFDHSHPLHPGKAKGVRAILEERGLWNHYHQQAQQAGQPALKFQCTTCSTSNIKKDILRKSQELISQAKANGYFLSDDQSVKEVISTSSLPQEADIDPATVNTQADNISKSCCWSMILSQQSDFLTERPLLQTIIEDAGHTCLFLPKFHCELNPIELFWSYIKTAYRKESHLHKSFADSKVLFERVRQACPVKTIRKYFRRIDRQISVYEQGYNGPQGQILMKKYKSHRCIPRQAAMRIDVLTA
ncbi:hypothetical protein PCANC_13305 [Puccinia coronata f. sp. avenae]|nr:hypothetical protein PCANC_13305 [Puccinia coronata f. sp. avenae]